MNGRYLLTLVLIACSFSACVKDNTSTPTPVHEGPDVYITGYHQGLNAAYWKNDSLVTLPHGQMANGIAVSGDDVYVAGNIGFEVSPGGGYANEAVYWKNGEMVKLGNPPSYANCIAVSGSDVYVAGMATVDDKYVATYWKNGNMVSLGNIPYSTANAIVVSGTDVYIAGFNGKYAAYWKNALQVPLEDVTPSVANAITISGGDIYVAGYETPGVISGVAVYWKNGIRHNLISPTLDTEAVKTVATGIAVSGGDVYVTGYVNNCFGVYWKNGVQTDLNNPATYVNVTNNVNNIVVSGSDVYISFNTADYWKNGSVVHVGSGYATSIVVRP